MTLIEKFFQIKAQDPLPYCPRAFLQQIYNLAYRNQSFTIVKLTLPEQNQIGCFAEIKKGKVVFYTTQGGRRTAAEIIGTAESLKQELSMLMSP
ncbi:hypothetical protein JCM39194_06660 [Desulfotomaculum varum]